MRPGDMAPIGLIPSGGQLVGQRRHGPAADSMVSGVGQTGCWIGWMGERGRDVMLARRKTVTDTDLP